MLVLVLCWCWLVCGLHLQLLGSGVLVCSCAVLAGEAVATRVVHGAPEASLGLTQCMQYSTCPRLGLTQYILTHFVQDSHHSAGTVGPPADVNNATIMGTLWPADMALQLCGSCRRCATQQQCHGSWSNYAHADLAEQQLTHAR